MNPEHPSAREDHVRDPKEQAATQTFLQVSANVAVLVLLLGSMLSSWALALVAGTLFVGLLIYAWISLDRTARGAFVLQALLVGGIAGGIATLVAIVAG